MNSNYLKALELLEGARKDGQTLEPLTQSMFPDLNLEKAYQINLELLKRAQARGQKLVGYKMGLTSIAKRKQMNLDQAIFSWLTQNMQVNESGFKASLCTQPKAEAELVFKLSQDVSQTLTLNSAADFVEGVAPGIEIIDSRFKGFKYFSLPDVVADCASGAYFCVGSFKPFSELKNLNQLKMKFLINGELKEEALSSEISGHPLQSLVELSALATQYGLSLKKGQIVFAGAATAALSIRPGMKVSLTIDSLPQLDLPVL